MKSVVILFAQPKYEKSQANQILMQAVANQTGITVHDLYE